MGSARRARPSLSSAETATAGQCHPRLCPRVQTPRSPLPELARSLEAPLLSSKGRKEGLTAEERPGLPSQPTSPLTARTAPALCAASARSRSADGRAGLPRASAAHRYTPAALRRPLFAGETKPLIAAAIMPWENGT